MITDLNTINLIGRLALDPDVRYFPSGLGVAKIRLVVNRVMGSGKEQRQDVYYFNVEAFGNNAILAQKYLSKGRRVAISGFLKYNTWKDQNGQSHSKTVVVADNIQFLDKAQRQKV